MAKRWDTPTDGISRKQFDRAMDSHIRRYALLAEEVRDLGLEVIRLRKVVGVCMEGAMIDEEE